MRQYINLYRGLEKKNSASRGALALVAVVLLALPVSGVYVFMQQRELGRLQIQADALDLEAKVRQARLADLTKRLGLRDGTVDTTQSALEARFKARERILATLASGALGNGEGYSEYLRALSRRSGKGVWLTDFTVAQGGASLSLSGRALEAERIPAYLAGLNGEKIFQGRGFAAFRVKQVLDPKAPEGKAGTPASIEFTLGTEREGSDRDDKPQAASAEAELMGKVK